MMKHVAEGEISASQRRLFEEALDLLVEKIAEDERTSGVEFPHVTAPDGRWQTYPASWSAGYKGGAWSHGHWTCGYWVGLLLAAYLHSHDVKFLAWAKERMRLVAQRADDPNTHDIGFIFDGSAIPGHHITGDALYAGIALRAAKRLRARLITTRSGAYLSSWGPLADARGRTSSAIDTMGNLSLLYWAAKQADDASFRHAAEAHAQKTAEVFIRPDGSTYHAVEYELPSGRRLRGYTFQGSGDESTWPRGQAWAIYGFVNTARETEDARYLDIAERLLDYYLTRLGDAIVPPWDFDDASPGPRPEDSSAAAIVAASLVELGSLHAHALSRGRWRARGIAMLEALCTGYLARDRRHRGLLLHGCYSKPHNDGVDSATMFGDFYFIEALCKLLMPGKFRPPAEKLGNLGGS